MSRFLASASSGGAERDGLWRRRRSLSISPVLYFEVSIKTDSLAFARVDVVVRITTVECIHRSRVNMHSEANCCYILAVE